MIDYGTLAQQAAEDHLLRCHEALDESEGDTDVVWPETDGPFCGCLTCIVRETLWISWPIMERYCRETAELRPVQR